MAPFQELITKSILCTGQQNSRQRPSLCHHYQYYNKTMDSTLPRPVKECVSLLELEALARQVLPQAYFDYYAGGATDELTLRRNSSDFAQIKLRPRMLKDISQIDTSTSALGSTLSSPICIAPTAFHGLAHSEGELATARAAARMDTLMTLSTLSNYALEEVIAAGPHHMWFQLYVYKDREITRDLVKRARESGYKALVVTVDSPSLGKRERDLKNGFHLPDHLQAKNLEKFLLHEIKEERTGDYNIDNIGRNSLASYIASLYDRSLTWKDLAWIVSLSDLPVLVKGIVRGDDAALAIKHGARGIIVSNHGGRQVDTTLSGIEALIDVAAELEAKKLGADKAEIYMDGGIRRGTDVIKALALGARAVFIGRPVLYGLALDGEAGVQRVLQILLDELKLAMSLCGTASLSDISTDHLRLPSSFLT